jgi:hypothetical protein
MDSLTSKGAAERLGVTVRQFHYLVERHGVKPVRELPGLRGAKFWDPSDIDAMTKAA